LRAARPADALAIRELVQGAYAHYPDIIGVRPAPMDADYEGEIASNEVWVVPTEDELVGVLVLRREPDHLFVDNVAVAPGSQGSGIGKALLEHGERRARELGLPELRLLTHELMTQNRSMYRHLGWEETEQRDEGKFSRVYFRKPVTSAPRGD
jgi:ribosomal protein S18 acetylase RimI-like enzyme